MLIEEVVERPPLLIMVHPGSACGSLNDAFGKSAGGAYRDGLVIDLNNSKGGVLIVDGEFSDEIPYYGDFNSAILNALQRAKTAGLPSVRIDADDNSPRWVAKTLNTVRQMGYVATDTIVVSGIWVGTDEGWGANSGCVTAVFKSLKRAGYTTVSISEWAIPDVDEYARDED